MALVPADLADVMDTELAAANPDYADSPDRASVKAKTWLPIATAIIEYIKNEGRVTGDDSNGDTHNLVIE